MKTFLRFPIFLGICGLLMGSAAITTNKTSAAASAAVDNLSPATKQELARARNATAKYHNFTRAVDYDFLACVPGEGFEYVNWDLVDCNFDIENPEALHYIPSGNGLRLVGVEYVVPVACTATPPEGFTGDDDEWEFEAEGLPIWALRAAIWMPNPEGMFAEHNPNIPDLCP